MKKKCWVIAVAFILLLTLSVTVLTACGANEVKVTVYDTDGTTVLETYKLKKGGSLTEKDLVFSKNGFTFGGVYTDAEFKNEYKISAVSEDLKLYARFSKDTYFISFVNDGGESIERVEVKTGEAFTLPTPAARTGYVFGGWTLDGELFDDTQPYSFSASIKLRAKWTAKTTNVSFDVNGGDLIMPGATQFTYGSAVILPAVQRTGYSFIGWAKGDENTAYVFGSAWAEDAENVAFTAIWAAKSTKVTFTLDGGAFVNNPPETDDNGNYFVNYAYDDAYALPVIKKAGYSYKWVVSGTNNEVAGSGIWDNTQTAIRLVAKWTANTYKVNLDAKEGTCDATEISSTYGAAIGYLPAATAPAGYIFSGWYYMNGEVETKILTGTIHNLAGNINAYAKYNKDTNVAYKIEIYLENANDAEYTKIDTVLENGETDALIDASAIYTGATAYMTLNDVKSAATKSGNIAADGSLVLKLYYDRKTYTVTVNENGGNSVSDVTAKYGAAITAPTLTRTGYEFNGWDITFPAVMPLNGTTVTAEWKANKYKLYLDSTLGGTYLETDGVKFENGKAYIDVEYDAVNFVIPNPYSVDYLFGGWKLAGADFTSAVKWTVLGNQTVTASWTVDENKTFFEVQNGKYFKEYENGEYVYVFVKGVSPVFESGVTLEVVGRNATVVSGNTLECNSIGSFTLIITSADGRKRTVAAKYVEYVDLFTRGADYTTSWVNRNPDLFLNDSATDVMKVGTANAFRPDLEINNGAETITTLAANVIFSVKNNGVAVDPELYSFENGEMILDADLIGQTITVTISPKYSLASQGTVSATFYVVVNDGYNVYDNASLKLAYENHNITTINVLRDVVIGLTEDKWGVKNGVSYIINDFDHCAYVRFANETETVTINGNYFNINGTNLPYFDNRYDELGFLDAPSAKINNVQSAIFGYSGHSKIGNATFPDAKLVINDMYLQGNNVKAADYSEVKVDGLDLYKMSGSFNGVRLTDCGDLVLNNSTIKNTLIAVFSNALGGKSIKVGTDYVTACEVALDSVMIDNSWANSVYCWANTNLTLSRSKLLTSSGAAVHIEDYPDVNYTGINTVTLDAATVIDNYVTGEEAWFVAYGMSTLATGIKVSMAQQISEATGGKLTVVKKDDKGPEYFNFAIFARSTGGDGAWKDEQSNVLDYQKGVTLNINYEGGVNLRYNTAEEGRLISPAINPAYVKPAVAPGYFYYTSTAIPEQGTMVALLTLEMVTA